MNRRWKDRAFHATCLLATATSVGLLVFLLVSVAGEGVGRFNLDLILRMPSEFADRAGIKLALVGSLWLIAITTVVSVPVGVATAIFWKSIAKQQPYEKSSN